MSNPSDISPESADQHIVIVGPDGQPISADIAIGDSPEDETSTPITDLIEQPAKVMLSVTVKLPAAPAITWMLAPVVEPPW